jgi:DNA-binding response OmpR family regulator
VPPAPRAILIAEDDRNIAALVKTYLRAAGFSTLLAHDGETALALARARRPALVVLDLMLPGMSGWEVCAALRRESDVPVLMLTARGEEMDRVAGLALGADDYVVKPFSPRELVERVRAILRRTGRAAPSGALRAGPLLLEPDKHRLTRDGQEVALTPIELRLLAKLMGSPGRVFTREELLAALHPDGAVVVDRVVDVHIGKLRQKLEADPSRPRWIQTVRGVGYRFRDSADEG